MFKRLIIVPLVLLAFVLVGCREGQVNIEADGSGGVNISLNLTEAEVNALVVDALNAQGDPVLRDTQVDLRSGEIVVSGTHDRRDGSGPVSGTLAIRASVSGGQPQISVSSLNIEGFALDDARIADLNERIAAGIAASANRDNNGVTLTGITITDTTLTISINARRVE
ncbi:MAG: hypothetical protein SF162_07115 [bacterium]|nr:hypothetical protein [bacterium]